MTPFLLLLALPVNALGWGFAIVAVLAGTGLAGFLLFRLRGVSAQKTQLDVQLTDLIREHERTKQTLNEALAAIENENFTDPLTDLRNRRYLSAIIRSDVAKVQRIYRDLGAELLPNEDLIFLMVDLDHFSRINDYYGAAVGDKALLAVADSLRRIVRETDVVIRWGGEEFLVVARNASRKEAPELAERIRTVMTSLSVETSQGEVLRWTCCVGFAAYPFQTADFGWLAWDRVVEIADACLTVAKHSGRNAWVGVLAKAGLERAKHGPRIPKDLKHLAEEGVLEVCSSREDPFAMTKKVGEILG